MPCFKVGLDRGVINSSVKAKWAKPFGSSRPTSITKGNIRQKKKYNTKKKYKKEEGKAIINKSKETYCIPSQRSAVGISQRTTEFLKTSCC